MTTVDTVLADTVPGLLPLPRPLMTGEVLDTAFRLFRASLLRCLPYSGLAVLVLELPTLHETLLRSDAQPAGVESRLVVALALLLGVALFGVVTLRLQAVSHDTRPRFRREFLAVLRRWPPAIVATVGALGFPGLLYALGSSQMMAANASLMILALPLLWPTAMLVVALPAFWIDGLGPLSALSTALRLSFRASWRMAGVCLATGCMLAVFYVLAALIIAMLAPLFGRTDLVLIAAVKSVLSLVIGAFGVPFVLAVLVVAYEDLKLRHQRRRVAAA